MYPLQHCTYVQPATLYIHTYIQYNNIVYLSLCLCSTVSMQLWYRQHAIVAVKHAHVSTMR